MKLQTVKTTATYTWRLLYPKANPSAIYENLALLRGQILYNNGDRPEFLNAENIPIDYQLLDAECYHILLYTDDELIGGARVLPITVHTANSVILDLIGTDGLAKIFAYFSGEVLCEASRLFVKAEHRNRLPITNLYAAALFISKKILGADILLSASGIKGGHHRFMANIFNAQTIPDFAEPLVVEKYNDSVQINYCDLAKKPAKLAKLLASFAVQDETLAVAS